ncbi:MAG: ankyrin repeat domain-containing protein, partial [Candidatus Poribacteria bacterium]|nr:ankyrin repeat domain-containing protein [Candidatus Poribacteria bacterium]
VRVRQNSGPVALLREETQTQNNWVSVKTVGVISNRDGIGTRITMVAGEQTQTREVNPGSSYMSTHDARCYFGLGANTTVDRLELRWQSGVVQIFENLPINQEHVISEFSDTPEDRLFKAVWTENIAALRGSSIDVNLKDAVGRSPLRIAAEKGDINVVTFLIENGADVNVTDANGNTSLIFIINKTGNLEITERLLEKGAAVNTQNGNGETALMYAAWRGHANIVRLLLQNRADATVKNRRGDTALSLADSQGHLEIVEILKAAMK